MVESFSYWSVADGPEHSAMMATCIASARRVGVKEDFHVYSDREIPGAINHKTGAFDHSRYIFKLEFLKNEVSKLDYSFFVFLDADNLFCRHPGNETFSSLLRSNGWFVQLESEMTSPFVKRDDWWGCQSRLFPILLKYLGVKSEKIWNTNAGFWIVRKEAIQEFYDKAINFYKYCRNNLRLINFTEEPPLAFVGHFVDDPEKNTWEATKSVWSCD